MDGEAKRLAVSLRVLLHDTKNSHSLLGQLGRKNNFVDTALEFDPRNKMTHGGLISVALGPPRTRYVAMLDDTPKVSQLDDFDVWWNAPVFVNSDRQVLTRRDLVLTAANQDGGAHVDPALDEVYARLARDNSMSLHAGESGVLRPMEGPERAALRQIAHEVLKSLKPGCKKMPQHEAGVFVAKMSLVPGPQTASPSPTRKIGRNAPCPCGSGKKYKRCHGAAT